VSAHARHAEPDAAGLARGGEEGPPLEAAAAEVVVAAAFSSCCSASTSRSTRGGTIRGDRLDGRDGGRLVAVDVEASPSRSATRSRSSTLFDVGQPRIPTRLDWLIFAGSCFQWALALAAIFGVL
jgi:hypothetical protein